MVKELKKFVELLKKYNLEELEVEDGDFKISLKRAKNIKNNTKNKTTKEEKREEEKKVNIDDNKEKEYKILSPIVGIFRNKYKVEASSLSELSEEEKRVQKDQVVAMIEILGQVVEVRSEVEGIMKEILVADGEAVEYNQPLMIIEQ